MQPWHWKAGTTYWSSISSNPRGIKSISLLSFTEQRRGNERGLVSFERGWFTTQLLAIVFSPLSAYIHRLTASSSPPTETNYSVLLPSPRLSHPNYAASSITSSSSPKAPVCVWSLRSLDFKAVGSHKFYEHMLSLRAFSGLKREPAAVCHFSTATEQASWQGLQVPPANPWCLTAGT